MGIGADMASAKEANRRCAFISVYLTGMSAAHENYYGDRFCRGSYSRGASAEAIANSRSNFSISHLRAAAHAAREAYDIEQANPLQYGPWSLEMYRLVTVSIVMAAAALEANANEIVQDILDAEKRGALQVTDGQRLLKLKEKPSPTMKKYRKLAKLLDKDPDTGSAREHAKRLMDFRNELMHFKPAWTEETDIHEGELSKWLKTEAKIPIAPGDQPPNSFRFPDGLMTYGCAKWSVETVLRFSESYAKVLGVKEDRFAAVSRHQPGAFHTP